MKKLMLSFILLLTTVVAALPTAAHAEEGEVGFSVQAILPENQVNSEATYFDLRMSPGQKQTIQVAIANDSNEDIIYDVNVNQAYTNENGFIDYDKPKSDKPFDESLKYKVDDLISYDNEVTVPAGETKLVDFQIAMPNESFDGEILAGIQVVKDPNRGKDTTGQITNLFAYVTGLRLTMTDTEVARELKVSEIKADTAFGGSAIMATVINPTMDAIGKLDYQGVVYQKGDKEGTKQTFEYVGKEMSMAPNSIYNFAAELGKKALKAGDYVVELKISDAKDNVWEFEEEFTITAKKAEEVNKIVLPKTETKAAGPSWIGLALGVGAGALVSGGLFLYAHLRAGKRKEKLSN
ncbi:DUF916 and DUF3324 domain-containing protein [Enterococcus diestrammenae]|uniref:DUF916 and DUF3324 domain-containing protein n=1 Tax=Enterococcus diestrammenae TaxID=1155073 RepID=UPI0022E72F7D|nr:DUF916 and DUF3324 domain-containing protein [Enterococcus diestrammenae]